MKLIIPAGLLCFSCTLLLGQQQPAPAPAPAPPQTPAATPVDSSEPDVASRASVGIFYWLSAGHPDIIGGTKTTTTIAGGSNLQLGDDHKRTPGVVIAFPGGKFNRLEVSYFQSDGTGNTTSTKNLVIFGSSIPANDYLATRYRVRNVKVSWNYLTWPSPPEDAKLRIKTLWEVQYTTIDSSIDAPFELSTAFNPPFATKKIIYPTFGLAAEYYPSKHFHLDARGSGFAFPHKAVIWDAEATAAVRFGHIEVFAGEKAYHFKTSPNADNYISATLKGPFGGLRWVF